jgi:hypothetical protein
MAAHEAIRSSPAYQQWDRLATVLAKNAALFRKSRARSKRPAVASAYFVHGSCCTLPAKNHFSG